MAAPASHHGRVGLLYTRGDSEQDNEGSAECLKTGGNQMFSQVSARFQSIISIFVWK